MTEIVHYQCDRCGAIMDSSVNLVRLTISHSEHFDLRNETVDLCNDCEQDAVEWLKQKPERRA